MVVARKQQYQKKVNNLGSIAPLFIMTENFIRSYDNVLPKELVDNQKVITEIFDTGSGKIELLYPSDKSSVLDKFLKNIYTDLLQYQLMKSKKSLMDLEINTI